MKRRSIIAISTGLVVALLASPVMSADRNETIRFKNGSTSETLKSQIRKYDKVRYAVNAESGQTLTIMFTGSNASCYFNILSPQAEDLLHDGSSAGAYYSNRLNASGTYTIIVYLMRNAARRNETCAYEITFDVSS